MTKAWTRYRSYRRTLSEFRALPINSLLNLDFHRGTLKVIVTARSTATSGS
jgi:hypothetical protein